MSINDIIGKTIAYLLAAVIIFSASALVILSMKALIFAIRFHV